MPMENKLRIITPYLYPDNDLIEIYVEELPLGQIRVTDLTETLRHLHARGFDVFESPKRRFMVETIASRTGVELAQGQLAKIGETSQVGDLLFDLIVAARGVSDLIYTSKTYEPATFSEEVEEFSNIHGLNQIRYAKGNIVETFGEILATIKREFNEKDG